MEMTTVCKICRRRCCVDCFANEKSNNSRINNFNTFAIASQNKEQSVKTLLEIKLDAKKLQLEKIKRKEELKAQLLLKKQQKEKLLQLVTNNNQFSGSASLLHQTLSHFDSLLLSQEKHLEKEVEKSKEVQRDISSSILKYEDEIKEERNRIVNEIRSIFPIVPSSNDPENYTSILNFPVPNQYRNPSLRVIDYAFVYGVIINLLSSYAKYLDVWLPNEISHRGSRSSIRNKHGFAFYIFLFHFINAIPVLFKYINNNLIII